MRMLLIFHCQATCNGARSFLKEKGVVSEIGESHKSDSKCQIIYGNLLCMKQQPDERALGVDGHA
jgi:hypothetical protein